MKNKIPLTIALTASMSFSVALAEQAKSTNAQPTVTKAAQKSPIAQGEGKCASGKCGSLKKFVSVKVSDDEAGKLVRVRDGSCGMAVCENYEDGKHEVAHPGKCSSGVCGQ